MTHLGKGCVGGAPSPLRLSHRGAGVLPVLPLLLTNDIANRVKTVILSDVFLHQNWKQLISLTKSPAEHLLMTGAYF